MLVDCDVCMHVYTQENTHSSPKYTVPLYKGRNLKLKHTHTHTNTASTLLDAPTIGTKDHGV